jgi:hypothetical protein
VYASLPGRMIERVMLLDVVLDAPGYRLDSYQ